MYDTTEYFLHLHTLYYKFSDSIFMFQRKLVYDKNNSRLLIIRTEKYNYVGYQITVTLIETEAHCSFN